MTVTKNAALGKFEYFLLWDFMFSLTKQSLRDCETLEWELPVTESCVELSSVYHSNSEGQ